MNQDEQDQLNFFLSAAKVLSNKQLAQELMTAVAKYLNKNSEENWDQVAMWSFMITTKTTLKDVPPERLMQDLQGMRQYKEATKNIKFN